MVTIFTLEHFAKSIDRSVFLLLGELLRTLPNLLIGLFFGLFLSVSSHSSSEFLGLIFSNIYWRLCVIKL